MLEKFEQFISELKQNSSVNVREENTAKNRKLLPFRDETFTYSAEGVLHQMKNIIKRFPKLFPDFDLTYFKGKCDALEKALKQ